MKKREVIILRIFLRKQLRGVENLIKDIGTHSYARDINKVRVKKLTKLKYELKGILNSEVVLQEAEDESEDSFLQSLSFEDVTQKTYVKALKRVKNSLDPDYKIERRTLDRIMTKFFFVPFYN